MNRVSAVLYWPAHLKKSLTRRLPTNCSNCPNADSLESDQAVVNIDGADTEGDEHTNRYAAGQDAAHDARSDGDQGELVVQVISCTQNFLLSLNY